MKTMATSPQRRHRAAGMTLIELLLALAITAVLSVALAMSVHASFMAYATTAESASTQSATRLTLRRVLKMVRGSELHDAYDPGDGTKTLLAPGSAGYPLQTVGLQMQLVDGREVRLWWAVNDAYGDADLGDLFYEDVTANSGEQVLLPRVRCRRTATDGPYLFTLATRIADEGLLLMRATVDLAVEPDPEQSLGMEKAKAATTAVRMVGSTMPRRTLEQR